MIAFDINMKFEYVPNKPQKMKELIDRTIAYAADRIEIEAKAKCPVKTGRLQNSIHQWEIIGGRAIAPDTPYDIYVEFGRYKQPYMRPAVDNTRELIDRFMKRQYADLMKEKKVRKK